VKGPKVKTEKADKTSINTSTMIEVTDGVYINLFEFEFIYE